MSTSVHWRLLRSNGLRLCRLQECCTTMRLWWLSQGTRTYWRCALNRTNIHPMVREVTCRVSVRRSTTVTAHLHLVWRALAIPAGVAVYHHLVGVALPSRAYCKRRTGPSRLPPPPRSHDPELQFDWSKILGVSCSRSGTASVGHCSECTVHTHLCPAVFLEHFHKGAECETSECAEQFSSHNVSNR